MGWVRGDAAGDLYTKGSKALSANDYATAVQNFDQIITSYPTVPNINEVQLRTGYAYLHLGDFPKAIDRLSRLTVKTAKPEFRAAALFYTALAQFSQGGKLTDKAQQKRMFGQTTTTLTNLINLITATPTPDNKNYLEDAIYYRALAQYQEEDLGGAEKDLLQLLQQFGTSLQRPDYLLRLGSLYAIEANKASEGKKSPDEIKALTQKSLEYYDRVSNDPNALVQANEADMSKAEVLYGLLAPLELPDTSGYQKALDAFRLVKRKEDMVALQEKQLQDLTVQSQAQLQSGGVALANENSRLIEREEGRLKDLKDGPDPIILALVRIGECYNALKQADEARTVLHRLAQATLTPEQAQEVDFQLLYSYALGGQTDKADAALTTYLSKHAGDAQADSISYQMAANLLQRKDFNGALAQVNRSLKDFPNGRYVGQVISLKAQVLLNLGQLDESKKVVDNYVTQHPKSPVANQLLLTKAGSEVGQGDLKGALADYKTVKDNIGAGAEMQAAGATGYIQTLQSLKQFDNVISESKAFETKYPNNKALPEILVISAIAMDQKQDPEAIAVLRDMVSKYPEDDTAPFALYYIITIEQRAGKVPEMIQAADDLRKAYPENYSYLIQAADVVSPIYVKQKKFDLAIAEYQPLVGVPQPNVAAMARNKIGTFWLQAAKAMGAYQSMQKDEERAEAKKRLDSAEQSYLDTLKNSPDQLGAVGDALQGLVDGLIQRRSWGLLTDAGFEDYLGKLTAELTTPEMQTRVELAKAGLVFVEKDGVKQYATALDRFKKALAATPSLNLTRQEANQYGELLIAGQDYPTALEVYNNLLSQAGPKDQQALADADYGLGATYLAQGDVAQAKDYFSKMKALSGGAEWHPHIMDANYGLALAAEQAGDTNTAKQFYAVLMRSPQVSYLLQAKAMLGYGRVLEKAGNGITPVAQGTIESAVHYYQQVNTLFGPATPALSAEGLFDAGQVYERAGDKVNAKKQYSSLIQAYAQTAPDWAAKAQAAIAKLGP